MINIEVRDNGKFDLGYPYNSSVDSYFTLLSDEFISNYNLTDSQIRDINNHKIKVQEFDKKLFEYVIKLSAFIKSFEEEGKPKIDYYNELVNERDILIAKIDILNSKYKSSVKDFEYIENNITTLHEDKDKLSEFILFYQSQLIEETYVYNDTYLNDTQVRLDMIDNIILTTENENLYYKTILTEKISYYTNTLVSISQYSFKDIHIKELYEAWQGRSENYYLTLVEYYKDEYESVWSYGKSIMYDEKLSYVNSAKSLMNEVASILQSTLFKIYNFKIEKEIKQYSLTWLNENETFEPIDFTFAVETKRESILEDLITALELIIKEKDLAVKSVISYNMNNDYFKYKELIQEKKKYIITNIGNLDNDMLSTYDNEILSLESNYQIVKNKLEQSTYWEYYHDLERHRELLVELNRQLTVVKLALSREFKKESGSNDKFIEKINYYTTERDNVTHKINDIVDMKDKLEITKNIYSDELTLLKSKIFELDQSINDAIILYEPYFNSRISFFTQNIELSNNETISNLLDGNLFDTLRKEYEEITAYQSEIEWYNYDDKIKLLNMYVNVLDIIDNKLLNQWINEFSYDILNTYKVLYYREYFDKHLNIMYATINYFILQNEYDNNIIDNLNISIKNILSIFSIYVDLAFKTTTNIEISTDIFNYDNKFIFDIVNGLETKDNVIKTFKGFVDNILSFVLDKNLDFKLIENNIENQIKIDTIWNDMEKKYV